MPDVTIGSPRIPFFTAANLTALQALTGNQEGDLGQAQDTGKLYVYHSSAWADVLAGVSQNLVLIGTTLLAAPATSISFASIPTGYKKFLVQFNCPQLASNGSCKFRVNNDSGANYEGKGVSDASAFTALTDCMDAMNANGNGSGTAPFMMTLDIQNRVAGDAQYKAYSSTCYTENGPHYVTCSGFWKNTASEINRIDAITSQNMAVGTRMTVWGVI